MNDKAMSSTSIDGNLLIVPSALPSLTEVELPCFVSSASHAINLLGGEAALVRSKATSSGLQISMSSDDPLRQAIRPHIVPVQSFLLKAVRRTVKDAVTGEIISEKMEIQAVAKVTQSHTFVDPFDFQVNALLFM
jgi:hypothetical protein